MLTAPKPWSVSKRLVIRHSARVFTMPAKRKIRARDFIGDIRGGMTTSDLMGKYRLSPNGIRRIFRQMVDAAAMTKVELESHAALYEEDQEKKGVRQFPRKRITSPLAIYDEGDPFKEGRVLDVSERGVCVEGVEAEVGQSKTFMVRLGGLSQSGTLVFEAKCRWVNNREADLKKRLAGFQITGISSLDSRQLQNLLFD